MKKVVLSGYYGFNNAGDEAVLFAIITSLRKLDPNIQITVLSNNPEETAKLYNVHSVNRWRIKEIIKVLSKSDLLISGGGSLLQDVTSKNGILYYLGVIIIAKMLRKPVFIYSQGIGPVNHKRNRILVGKILNKLQGITVRDEHSKKDLEEMGVKKNITVSVDPVLGFEPEDINIEKGLQLFKEKNVDINGNILGISIRPWKTDEKNFINLARSCDVLIEKGWQVVFIPMHYPEDVTKAKEVAELMQNQPVILEENYTPYETMCIYKAVDMVLGMRLHSLIMAAVLEKPVVAISYDPKVDRFMKQLDRKDVLHIDNLKTQEIIDLVQNTWQNKDNYLKNLKENLPPLRNKAIKPAKMVIELLGKK